MFEDRERHGRDATGFLLALTYTRRKTTGGSTVGHSGGKELHDKFLADMKLDDERRTKKNRGGSQRSVRTSRASLISLTHPATDDDPTEEKDSSSSLSRSNRTQQSFLRKKFGSMSKKATVKKNRNTFL